MKNNYKTRMFRWWAGPVVLVLLWLAFGAPPVQAAASPQAADAADAAFVPGELVVGFHAERFSRQQAEIQTALANLSVQSIESVTACAPSDATVQTLVRRITVPPGAELSILAQLERLDAVLFAAPNPTVRASAPRQTIPPEPTEFAINDPLYPTEQWYAERIHAEPAWSVAFEPERAPDSLQTIQVAIIDSGINFDHPEFSGRILAGYNYLAPATRPADDFGHGAHVAGLMGATLNNSTGIAGVAPQVIIDPRKVLDAFGGGSLLDVAAAICDAADAGAHIINLSLEAEFTLPVLEDAVAYAYEQGILMIAAAGNSNETQVYWPAAYPEVMAVAATNINNMRAGYSNTGDEVEIAAPGGDSLASMLSTWRARANGESITALCPFYTNPADGAATYCYTQGTSMAAGLVSGAAALVWSLNPALTAEEVRLTLRNTTTPLAEDVTNVGQGLLNVEKAVRSASSATLHIGALPPAREISLGAPPYTVTIPLENPSLEPLAWRATIPAFSWLSAVSEISGTIRYGTPGSLLLEIRPTALPVGEYGSAITIVGTRLDGTQVTKVVNINFTVINVGNGIRSDLLVASDADEPQLAPDALPYTATLTLENPSTEPIEWQATLPLFDWITTTNSLSGSVQVGESPQLSVQIRPGDLAAGEYRGVITFIGTRADATQVTRLVEIGFTIVGEGPAAGDLVVSADASAPTLPAGSPPYTVTLTLENTGAEALDWQAHLPPVDWISASHTLSGTLDPAAFVQLLVQIRPTDLPLGEFGGAITFTGTRTDGTHVAKVVEIRFTITEPEQRIHLPLIRQNANGGSQTSPLP
jgi:subtilisin family serine protease